MEKLLWEIAFALAVIGGVAGLWALQRSAAKDALGAARQAWQQQAASREKSIREKADEVQSKAAADLEAMRLEAAARAVDWEARMHAAEEHHVRKSQEWESEKTNLEQENGALGLDVEKFRPDHTNIEGLKDRLKDMREVWLNPASSEWDCQKVLAKNLWVLSPDYVVGRYKMHVTADEWISTILQRNFEQPQEGWNAYLKARQRKLKGPVSRRRQPDLCGWVETRGLGPSASQSSELSEVLNPRAARKPECIFLIVELKAPDTALTWENMEQAHAYAWYLLQNVKELQKQRIECLVVGENCDGLNDAHIRWGSGPHDAIRIIPMSYRQLYERAEAMTYPYVHKEFSKKVELRRAGNVDHVEAAVPEVTQGATLAFQAHYRVWEEPMDQPQSGPAEENPNPDFVPLTPPASDLPALVE